MSDCPANHRFLESLYQASSPLPNGMHIALDVKNDVAVVRLRQSQKTALRLNIDEFVTWLSRSSSLQLDTGLLVDRNQMLYFPARSAGDRQNEFAASGWLDIYHMSWHPSLYRVENPFALTIRGVITVSRCEKKFPVTASRNVTVAFEYNSPQAALGTTFLRADTAWQHKSRAMGTAPLPTCVKVVMMRIHTCW